MTLVTREELGDAYNNVPVDPPSWEMPPPDLHDRGGILNLLSAIAYEREQHVKWEHDLAEMQQPYDVPRKRFHLRTHLAIAEGIWLGIRLGLFIADRREKHPDSDGEEEPMPLIEEESP